VATRQAAVWVYECVLDEDTGRRTIPYSVFVEAGKAGAKVTKELNDLEHSETSGTTLREDADAEEELHFELHEDDIDRDTEFEVPVVPELVLTHADGTEWRMDLPVAVVPGDVCG
jgi:hypothetical protein